MLLQEILHLKDDLPGHQSKDKHQLALSSGEGCYKENFFHRPTAQDPDSGVCPAVQEGTSAGRTSLSSETSRSSETTQQDLNTSLDACLAKPLQTTLPDQEEPSVESTDTTEAHPMEGEEKENNCIYLRYSLAMDILLCPFCYLVRGFQYLGGLSRHLKKIHSKWTTFRCALCDLPLRRRRNVSCIKSPAKDISHWKSRTLPVYVADTPSLL